MRGSYGRIEEMEDWPGVNGNVAIRPDDRFNALSSALKPLGRDSLVRHALAFPDEQNKSTRRR